MGFRGLGFKVQGLDLRGLGFGGLDDLLLQWGHGRTMETAMVSRLPGPPKICKIVAFMAVILGLRLLFYRFLWV